MSQTAPYGKWESAITADSIVQGSIAFDDVFVDATENTIYHIERRPEDNARHVIVETLTGQDIIPSPYSACSRVEEYGGAAAIAYRGTVYFSHFVDNRVYSIKAGTKTPEPVTPDTSQYYYSDFAVYPVRDDLLVSILEDHTVDAPESIVTTLCVINTTRKTVFPLVAGADFYACPVFNPSGTKIAWQEWYHPDMPWEGALIYVADVLAQEDTLVLLNKTYVAGAKLTKSVTSPAWATDTTLVFTSDELNGFQNPFVYSTVTNSTRLAVPASIQEDFAQPAWELGDYPYAILDDPMGGDNKYGAFTAMRDGRSVLYLASLSEKPIITEVEFPFSMAKNVRNSGGTSIVFIANKSDAPGGVFTCKFTGTSLAPTYQVLKSSASDSTSAEDKEYISPPQPITLYRDGKPLYVVYYPPTNPKYSGSSIPGEKPPCIVNIHGGPTGMTAQTLSWSKIYFTSRGYAWLDVNYGGSSGYGRDYVSRLAGNWGIVDVQDSQDASRMLAAPPYSLIDGSRVAIRGGSAGGFTTLAAVSIARDPSYFKAANSLFGLSDLPAFMKSTHKFELRYLEKLIGGTLAEVPEVFAARSAVNYAHRIVTPLLVLQGADDKIVPPQQAERIVNTIKEQGGEDRVEYHLFPGEGHGWQLASTIKAAIQYEHDWYDKKLL